MTTKNKPSLSREVENFSHRQWISANLWHLVAILLLLNLGVSLEEVISIPHQELIVNTDQARYQQGDHVRVWAVLPVLHSDILISFEVDDPNAQPMLILSKLSNTSGIAEINFSLSHNAAKGIYDVYASTANETGKVSFEVVTITTTTTTTTRETTSETDTTTTTTTSEAARGSFPGFFAILVCFTALVIFIRRHKKI